MHREPLLRLLEGYVARWPEEAGVAGRMIGFVRSEPECFERSLGSGHVTGSAWIVDAAGERVLLTHHRKLGKWLQPGGHVDGNPDVLAAAMREAEEESGLAGLVVESGEVFDVDIHVIPERGEEPEHEHFDVRFVFRAAGSREYVVSEESHDLAWVPLGELEEYSTEESMLRMRRKWLRAAGGG